MSPSTYPAAFSCANDYADLKGEVLVQTKIIGARFMMKPMRNGYHAASHMGGEGEHSEEWFCANSFLYVVRGDCEERRDPISLQLPVKERLKQLGERLEEANIPVPPAALVFTPCL